MTANSSTAPRVYVACLASYNAGRLHGEWIDATDEDEIREGVATMLRRSPCPNVLVECPECEGTDDDCPECGGSGTVPSAEEWAIHDYEGFEGFRISEGEDFERVAEIARLLDEHGPAYAAYASCVGEDYATADGFEEAYCGEYDSEEDYAYQWIQDCYNLDDMMGDLAGYFDYEKYARDLFINDMTSEDNPEGGIFVFRR